MIQEMILMLAFPAFEQQKFLNFFFIPFLFFQHYAGQIVFHSFFVQILAQIFVVFIIAVVSFSNSSGRHLYFFVFHHHSSRISRILPVLRHLFPNLSLILLPFFDMFQIIVPFHPHLSDVFFHLFGHFIFFHFYKNFGISCLISSAVFPKFPSFFVLFLSSSFLRSDSVLLCFSAHPYFQSFPTTWQIHPTVPIPPRWRKCPPRRRVLFLPPLISLNFLLFYFTSSSVAETFGLAALMRRAIFL